MTKQEKLFRIQIFQYVLSTLTMYPIRLYKNDCYDNFVMMLKKDEVCMQKLCHLFDCTDIGHIIPAMQNALKKNPSKYYKRLYELLDQYSERLKRYMWKTKPSNSLVFTREIKSNRALWLHLMLYDLMPKDFIKSHFDQAYVHECLIGMKSVFIGLDDDLSIVIGRIFDEDQDMNQIILNIVRGYHITNSDIFELTKLAQKRKFFKIDEVKKDAYILKKAFVYFYDLLEKLPLNISKEALEKVSVFVYMIVKEGLEHESLVLEEGILSFEDAKFKFVSSVDISQNSKDIFESYFDKYIRYRSFFQNELTSRLKSSLAKKYTSFREDDEFYPIKEVIERIVHALNADGGCYIKYHLSRQTFQVAAVSGEDAYKNGMRQFIRKINKKDKTVLQKSRVAKIVSYYYDPLYHDDIDKLIIFNHPKKQLLQPVEGKSICSNIAIPVTFKHKLLGVVLIDSFRANAFSPNDIQVVLSISNALSIQIYEEVVEKNLLAIIQNIPNQTQIDDAKTMDNISSNIPKYINSIFLSLGVDIWSYQDEEFRRVSSTIKNGHDKNLTISTDEPELICKLVHKDQDLIEDMDIKSSNSFFRCKPYEADSRINAVKIFAIKDHGKLIGALSVYNRVKDDYISIDVRSLKSVKNYLEIFFSVILTFKRQKELVHSHALHDINQNIFMVEEKCAQLRDLLFYHFKELDRYSRYRFKIKISDIKRFTQNMKTSFSFISGKEKYYAPKNQIDLQIDTQFKQLQKSFKSQTRLLDIINSIINSIPHKHKNLKILLNVEDISLKIAPILLEDIFTNLIQNAVKYSMQNTTISIRAITLKHIVQIRVENIGIQIKEDEVDDIFEYEYRGFSAVEFEEEIDGEKISYPRSDGKNAGLGLYKSKKIAKLFSGALKLEDSTKDKRGYKNIFLLTIPTRLVNQPQILDLLENRLLKKFKG